MSLSQPPALNLADYQRQVRDAQRPALIGFRAEWCVPCRSMESVFANLMGVFGERVLIATVDIDDEPELAEQLGIGSVPTLVLFKDGLEVRRQLHLSNEADLEQLIEQHLLPFSS